MKGNIEMGEIIKYLNDNIEIKQLKEIKKMLNVIRWLLFFIIGMLTGMLF